MGSKQVIIELRFQFIDLVVFERGQRTSTRRMPVFLTPEPTEWAASVRRASSTLRKTVQELRLEGHRAIVLYRSPTQAVQLANLEMKSPAQAVEAALLSCTDTLPYSNMAAVCEGAVVGRDASDDRGKIHVLVAADRDDVAAAIVHMVEEAGLRLASATPIEAGIIGKLAHEVLKRDDQRSGMLYVGQESSFFFIHEKGDLLFDRRLGIGLESLTNALMRPIHRTRDEKAIELDLPAAQRILSTFGIPSRDELVDEENGLTGDQIIPLLQPVFERFVIQLRQSLRFDVPEDERAHFPVILSGPGSALRGLAELLETELKVKVERDDRYSEYDFHRPGSHGSELVDAVGRRSLLGRVNLLPLALGQSRRISRLRRWLWAGAAAALVAIAFDGARIGMQINDANQESYDLERRLADVQPLRDASYRVREVVVAMSQLERTISQSVGASVPYGKVLHELGRLTPESIRITTISASKIESGAMCTVSGYAFPDAVGKPVQLEAYVDRLRSSPMFREVSLGTVQMGEIGGVAGQRFEVTFEPIKVPHTIESERTAQAVSDSES